MKDFTLSELATSIKYQFSRRCSSSDHILSHTSQDFIARYSSKHQPHPDFFKQDASLVHNQLTLYSDECSEAMRKFQFLDCPAQIISSLLSAILKINQFLAKQLYHQLKNIKPEIAVNLSEPLCAGCSKLRQNQKVRVLMDDLQLNRSEGNYVSKMVKEMVWRKGQKYDVQQLLNESLQNLDVLNEDEIRKKLGKLETDHDSRRHQMMICLDELARANQKMSGYNKIAQKKGKQWQGKFNVKDYVFQLSRHFHHNLSSIDHRIKLLKQNLSPIVNTQTQTEQQYILFSGHKQIVNQYVQQISNLKNFLSLTQSSLLIQEKKYKEQVGINQIFQKRMQDLQVEHEKLKIAGMIIETQLKGNLEQVQNKANSLESIVKKMKTAPRLRDVDLIEQLQDGDSYKNETSFVRESDREKEKLTSHDSIPSEVKQQVEKLSMRSRKGFIKKKQLKQIGLLNTRVEQKLKRIKFDIGEVEKSNEVIKKIEDMYVEIDEQSRARLSIVKVYSQTIQNSFPIKINLIKEENFLNVKDVQEVANSLKSNRKKSSMRVSDLSKKIESLPETVHLRYRVPKLQHGQLKRELQKLATIKGKQNMISLQIYKPQDEEQIDHDNDEYQKPYLEIKRDKLEKKTCFQNKHIFKTHNDQKFSLHQQKSLKKQGNYEGLLKKVKGKRKRNLSQESIIEDKQIYSNIRQSIDKIISKEINLFTDEDSKALIRKSQEGDLKASKKHTFYRGEGKNVLSLQEINYSTYFYSLAAKLHLANPIAYLSLKKLLSSLSTQTNDQDGGVKNSITALIISHRKCKGGGSICSHLEHFLQKVKNI